LAPSKKKKNNDNIEELEIDPEDAEVMERLENIDMSIEDIYHDMMAQVYEKHAKEFVDEKTNMDKLNQFGVLIQTIQRNQDEIDRYAYEEYFRNK